MSIKFFSGNTNERIPTACSSWRNHKNDLSPQQIYRDALCYWPRSYQRRQRKYYCRSNGELELTMKIPLHKNHHKNIHSIPAYLWLYTFFHYCCHSSQKNSLNFKLTQFKKMLPIVLNKFIFLKIICRTKNMSWQFCKRFIFQMGTVNGKAVASSDKRNNNYGVSKFCIDR